MDENNAKYIEFLLAEYNNIAQAHFNVKNQTSIIFKHYLWLMSLPFAIIAFGQKRDQEYLVDIEMLTAVMPYIFIIIFVIGVMFLAYIANLTSTASLYARQVNGIRYYFNKIILTKDDSKAPSILPIDPSIPNPSQNIYKQVLLLSIIVFNSFYILMFVKICPYNIALACSVPMITILNVLVYIGSFIASVLSQIYGVKLYLKSEYNKYELNFKE